MGSYCIFFLRFCNKGLRFPSWALAGDGILEYRWDRLISCSMKCTLKGRRKHLQRTDGITATEEDLTFHPVARHSLSQAYSYINSRHEGDSFWFGVNARAVLWRCSNSRHWSSVTWLCWRTVTFYWIKSHFPLKEDFCLITCDGRSSVSVLYGAILHLFVPFGKILSSVASVPLLSAQILSVSHPSWLRLPLAGYILPRCGTEQSHTDWFLNTEFQSTVIKRSNESSVQQCR